MPIKELKDRNKDIVQLYKIGWRKIDIANLFHLEKSNNSKLIRRDFDKYPYPTLEELNSIEQRYQIKVGDIKRIESPNNIKQTN